MTLRAVGFIPLFMLFIWALGFTAGAPAAVLTYLVATTRERIVIITAVTLAAYLLIEMIMVRLLHVPFPAGALLGWSGAVSAR
jgi:hypothetical protein